MNCRGLHCHGCHHSRLGGPIIALLVLLAISAAARAVARVLPVLLHLLIITAITVAAAAAVIATAVLAVRRAARPNRRVRQPLWRPAARVIRAAPSGRRELPTPPWPRSLPAPNAIPETAPPPARQASGRTPPS